MIAVVAVVASVIDGRVVPLSAQLVLRYMYVADVCSTLQDVTVAAHGDGVATALERNGRAWRAVYLGTYRWR